MPDKELLKDAQSICSCHKNLKICSSKRKIIKNLDNNFKCILSSFKYIDSEAKNGKELVPAAEWLMDNIYLIEKEYKDIKHNMPEDYYKKLPVIKEGEYRGYTRIYHIAWEITHGNKGKIDENAIMNFINEYQKSLTLTSNELWALPFMLRIAIIQDISRLSSSIANIQSEREKANAISKKIIYSYNENKLNEELTKLKAKDIKFTASFAGRLLKSLRDNGVENNEIYKWIEDRLSVVDLDSKRAIIVEQRRESSLKREMGNCINSIREVEALNWRYCFENLSVVEKILKNDPEKIYENMDFASRDYYRINIEKIAIKASLPESYIAKTAIECAVHAKNEGKGKFESHVGYYIVDNGVQCLKDKLKLNKNTAANIFKKHKEFWYLFGNFVGTALLIAAMILISVRDDKNVVLWKYIISALVIAVPCSEIVNSILNWSINHLTEAAFIPKLDFSKGIPNNCKTIVAIPAILNDETKVNELAAKLEIYYLSNSSENIYFAILGDFKDCKTETDDVNDIKINNAGISAVKKLNEKYSKNYGDIFYFFNRHRVYNSKEKKWIGWERKRGKLMEFNHLLRGDGETNYNVISSSIENLKNSKYVITLDADTQLPLETAEKLIGSMEHPLNKPYVQNGKLTRGYGIMQPRVSISVLSANKTIYSKIFSGETGIDTYSTAVSDVYQDLFGRGIYTGKGIYNIDAFDSTLKGRIKENSVLSHDLIEGEYAGCALVTDIELIDGYPAHYDSSSMRIHRWVRGDWQLLPYIFKNSGLKSLSKWKMLDNLRRSLLAPSVILLIIISLTIVPDGFEKWLSLAFVSLVFPWLFDVTEVTASPIRGFNISGEINSNKNAIEQIFFIFSFICFKAYLMLDAVIRTIYRLTINKNHMLQWRTSEEVEAESGRNLWDYVKLMWIGSIIAAVIGVLSFNRGITLGFVMLPSCILWFISPVLAFFISKDRKKPSMALSSQDRNMVRRISRKTFAYFEDFVNDYENWLAPDNFQENPPKGVAHRTSPTNMGMGLTSNIAAYDLGYISIYEMISRIEKSMDSMETLEKYKGHFLNWYDTTSKVPLEPKYVSTVDSGNLVGYLWLCEQSLEEYMNCPLINIEYKNGLCDVLMLANDEIQNVLAVKDYYSSEITKVQASKLTAVDFETVLTEIKTKCENISNSPKASELYWNSKALHQIKSRIDEINKIFPWIHLVEKRSEMLLDKAENIKKISNEVVLKDIPNEIENIINTMKVSGDAIGIDKKWVNNIIDFLNQGKNEIVNLIARIVKLQGRLHNMAENTDFKVLYDRNRNLFAIGYNLSEGKISNCFYDLLASESRQASFIAIAKGDAARLHWFKLGRAMTNIANGKGLVSWSGTMFEYFMPLLIMKNYPDTLLNETYINVIKGQKDYARKRHMPFWGISESAFYSFDISANYQYKAFGVPGIGLKRGLVNEVVISPYSTILAMQKDLYSAIRNLNKIIASGMEGKYGLYEAMDCTNSRMPKGMKNAIIKCFMVHHEGMSLLALDNILKGFVLQNRFHKIPRVKSTELLLQERVPQRVVYDREQTFEIPKENDIRENLISRHYRNPNMEMPESDILSNGTYSVMITDTGSGYGKKDDMMIYRWKGDSTEDDTGMFFYIKDISTGKMFSATYEPCKNAGDSYETTFSLDKAEFKRKDGDIETKTEVAVSNEDNAEVRRITIKNTSKQEKSMEITSYCEVTLANLSADEVHPAFSNLFIRTEFLKNPMCILANRRPRAKNQDKPWLMQTIVTDSETIGDIQYETRREEFVGRNGDLILPKALKGNNNLKNSSGDVIDPIISFRIKVKIPAQSACSIAYISSISKERQEAVELAKKYSDMQNVNGIFNFAPSEIHAELNYLGIKPNQANLYQLMASKILFLNTMVRERAKYIENVKKSQSALWSYGISGDLPIVLLIVRNESDIGLVKQMVNAHEYWAMKGLKVDLVILDMKDSGYLQEFNNLIRDEISSGHSKDLINKSAGIFLYGKNTMDSSDIEFLIAIAKLVVDSNKGLLVSQIKSSIKLKDEIPYLEKKDIDYGDGKFAFEHSKLSYYNGYGGFDTQKDEYVIRLNNFENTPAPWLNVISNKNFGFHVSETGSAYTWCENSRENKITPWSNDYITDRITEALYLRDEDTGEIWSITPKPIRDSGEYIIEHGKGYTNFKHAAKGIVGEMTMFVPMEENLKIIKINLKNISKIKRNISLTYYAQLVLGVVPRNTAMHIVTNIHNENEFIYARNPYSENFGNMYAYMKIFGGEQNSFTGNRREFIGRDGSEQNPRALLKKFLTGNCGAGLDPCMAENSKIVIDRGEEKDLYVILGEEDSLEKINSLILKYSKFENILSEFSNTKDYWKKLLNKIRVKTPDESMNIMLNGWLMYQTLSCRIWARTAFYQSGGAYGFRDQLQDVMSLCFLDPEMTRKQIIINASRQFLEGDVQHWWHPVVNSGIRTRFSDDLLWLPYVTDFYIRNTGDYSILDETVNYLEDSELKENEDERYSVSKQSERQGTIYEHCVKAIEKGLKFGIHNIPLMGSGDWNDGMSTVGNKGKGESVWLGWFLYSILNNFKNICRHNGDEYRAQRYTELGEFVKENVGKNAWDGKWYRRAYFDDGMPLGSSKNDECRIDSLAQSWAVISKGSDIKKAKVAMESVEKYLVKEDKKMVLLLTPAFNNSKMEPGYIKGYIPGVRENGGQYTHAATWVILAMAKLKEEDKAWKLFNMINPINHAKTKSESDLYKVEPYVMAADVYAEESNSGRGGWTWYTGTAGWMYRVGIEDILGLTLSEGKGFEIHPCVPHEWKEYEIDYTHENCEYKIKIQRGIKKSITLDGKPVKEGFVPYLAGGKHEVKVTI